LKPELTFTFLFFIFFVWERGVSTVIGNQTPPSTAAENNCSDSGDYFM